MGKFWDMSARDYFAYKKQLLPKVMEAYHKLEEEYDIKILDPRTAAVSEKLVIQESGKEAFLIS